MTRGYGFFLNTTRTCLILLCPSSAYLCVIGVLLGSISLNIRSRPRLEHLCTRGRRDKSCYLNAAVESLQSYAEEIRHSRITQVLVKFRKNA